MISTRSGSIWNHSGRYRYRSQRGGRSQREAEITEAEIIEGMISNLEDLDLDLRDLDHKLNGSDLKLRDLDLNLEDLDLKPGSGSGSRSNSRSTGDM